MDSVKKCDWEMWQTPKPKKKHWVWLTNLTTRGVSWAGWLPVWPELLEVRAWLSTGYRQKKRLGRMESADAKRELKLKHAETSQVTELLRSYCSVIDEAP